MGQNSNILTHFPTCSVNWTVIHYHCCTFNERNIFWTFIQKWSSQMFHWRICHLDHCFFKSVTFKDNFCLISQQYFFSCATTNSSNLIKRTLTVGDVSLYGWSPVLGTSLGSAASIHTKTTYFLCWSSHGLLNWRPAVQGSFLERWMLSAITYNNGPLRLLIYHQRAVHKRKIS